MSKGLIVATLAVLLGLLGFMSYSLNKQTAPPEPPSKEEIEKKAAATAAANKARKDLEIKAQDAILRDKKKLPASPVAASENPNSKAAVMKEEMARAMSDKPPVPAIKNKPPKPMNGGGTVITGKWFEDGQDGVTGIEKAKKELKELDKQRAASARAEGLPIPPPLSR